MRPVTIYVSRAIARRPGPKANTITAAMLLLSIALPVLVWLVDSTRWFYLSCFAGALAILFLDVLDGEVARLRKEVSDLGYYLDMGLWFSLSTLSVVVLLRSNQWFLQSDLLVVVILTIAATKLYLAVASEQLVDASAVSATSDRSRGTSKILMRGLAERPSLYLYFFIAVMVFAPDGDWIKPVMWALVGGVLILDQGITIGKVKRCSRLLQPKAHT